MDTSRQEGIVDPGASNGGNGSPGSYVYADARAGRIQILDQDDEVVLDFLGDDKVANRLAFKINAGTLKV